MSTCLGYPGEITTALSQVVVTVEGVGNLNSLLSLAPVSLRVLGMVGLNNATEK